MASENTFLLHALLMGIFITFLYDLLRVLRRVIPHRLWMISLEDILFWIYCAAKVFLLLYHESNGTLRWFAVMGALVGMVLYLKLVSPFFVKYTSLIIGKLMYFIGKGCGFLASPIRRLWKSIRKRMEEAARKKLVKRQKRKDLGRDSLKKKLTYLKKMLRMSL